MNPYLITHRLYTSDPTRIPWRDVMEFHLQHGVVLSSAKFFLLARPVPAWLPLHLHDDLTHFPAKDLGTDPTWHIWAAAGSMPDILAAARIHGLTPETRITFARHRSTRVRCYPLAMLDRFF